MKKIAERVDRVTRSDRLFFERRPDRQYRIRLASQAEIEAEETLTGAVLYVPEGTRVFVAVCNIAPGIRLRMFFRGIEGSETDLDEATARAIYSTTATDQSLRIEGMLRKAASA